jgi:hypothetical protein
MCSYLAFNGKDMSPKLIIQFEKISFFEKMGPRTTFPDFILDIVFDSSLFLEDVRHSYQPLSSCQDFLVDLLILLGGFAP